MRATSIRGRYSSKAADEDSHCKDDRSTPFVQAVFQIVLGGSATGIAGVVVFFELWAIAYVRARFM
jgi:hypothetical protein